MRVPATRPPQPSIVREQPPLLPVPPECLCRPSFILRLHPIHPFVCQLFNFYSAHSPFCRPPSSRDTRICTPRLSPSESLHFLLPHPSTIAGCLNPSSLTVHIHQLVIPSIHTTTAHSPPPPLCHPSTALFLPGPPAAHPGTDSNGSSADYHSQQIHNDTFPDPSNHVPDPPQDPRSHRFHRSHPIPLSPLVSVARHLNSGVEQESKPLLPLKFE